MSSVDPRRVGGFSCGLTLLVRSIPAMSLSAGEMFASYRIVRLLGSGGMGEVYLAEHPRLPRRDALKVLPAEFSADSEYRQRFVREADLAANLWHPHIVSVHDRGEHNGQLWISMNYVDGVDAAHLLSERAPEGLPTDQVLRIVEAVASALDYAHKQGLLHRDVKPANIMLSHADAEGEQRVLLTDFGIARSVGEISGLTATNMTVGTVAYSAPEQLLGEDLDGRTDQYALAATAYHLLTGSHLFPHSSPAVVISRHLNVQPPALADTRPELAALDPIMSMALAKDPNDRFQRCSDFARALNDQNGSASRGTFASAPTRLAKAPQQPTGGTVKRSSRPWFIAAVVGVVLVAVVGFLAWRPWSRDTQSTPGASTSSASTPVTTTTSAKSPPPAVFPSSAIETLMLTPAEIRRNTNGEFHGPTPGTDMIMSDSSFGTYDKADYITPPTCVGVVFGADNSVYKETGFEAIRDQTFDPSRYMLGNTVEQTAVVFPTADQARAVLASQTKRWQTCASSYASPQDPRYQIFQNQGEGGFGWALSPVAVTDDLITVKMGGVNVMGEGNHQACQQALGRRANVIVQTKVCKRIEGVDLMWADPSAAPDYGKELAATMLKRIAG
jgi:serine/threonine protein kinase